jgi:orotidine-5'-phosphate decarboxylase
MTSIEEMPKWAAEARERIIVALDVPTEGEALALTEELNGAVGAFKVGLQLFCAAGPSFVKKLVDQGIKVFLDLKFHDIPNTVAAASVEAARMGVWMFNLHCSGGRAMMEKAIDEVSSACERDGIRRPLIIGVTVLTSSDEHTLEETGISAGVEEQVTRLAALASKSGLDGIVASAREVRIVREAVANLDFLTVTPGIRPTLATVDDQKRVTTLGQALSIGSDYVVIGRPITRSTDRLAAVRQLCEEIRPK